MNLDFVLDESQAMLEDLVKNICFDRDGKIGHNNRQFSSISPEFIERLERLSVNLKKDYLKVQLTNYLYYLYYQGFYQIEDRNETKFINNLYRGLNVDFYSKLQASNQGSGYFDHDWLVVQEEDDGALAVQKEGLTLHVSRTQHLQQSEQKATIGELVSILLPSNAVDGGIYIAIANSGKPQSKSNNPLINIYFNVDSEGALALGSALTEQLNRLEIPFIWKILDTPEEYERYDSAILNIEKDRYDLIKDLIKSIYLENKNNFQSGIPIFSKMLAKGLGICEEPETKTIKIENFGIHRGQILAKALLESYFSGHDSPENRVELIVKEFESINIVLDRPHLNFNSEDIYQSLQI